MKVKELLTDEGKWVKLMYARTATGQSCSPKDPDAVCFCLLGAVHRCYGSANCKVTIDKLYAVPAISECGIEMWNAHPLRTFPEVRAVLEALDI